MVKQKMYSKNENYTNHWKTTNQSGARMKMRQSNWKWEKKHPKDAEMEITIVDIKAMFCWVFSCFSFLFLFGFVFSLFVHIGYVLFRHHNLLFFQCIEIFCGLRFVLNVLTELWTTKINAKNMRIAHTDEQKENKQYYTSTER